MNGRTIRVTTVPSVTVFVRHSAGCPRKGDEFYKACKCPKHLRWSNNGKQYRQAAKTRTWSIAEERRREVEAQFAEADPATPVGAVKLEAKAATTIERAVELFLSDKRSQGLDTDLLKKYDRELTRLSDFMAKRTRFLPREIRLEDLTEFRSGWDKVYPSSLTRSKVQKRLRGFLRYCLELELIDRVPKLSSIQVTTPPTLPLTDEQYDKLLAAVHETFSPPKAKRIHAFIRLVRHSGLAIRDAVTLERCELQKDERTGVYRVVTSRQKTGTHVSVPIPPDVASEILAAMGANENPEYIFWNSGAGTERTIVTNWQTDLREAFVASGNPNGHSHQLRELSRSHCLRRACRWKSYRSC